LRYRQRRIFVQASGELPRSPDAVYDTIMARIESQAAEDTSLALRILSWIFYAREPLSFGQLQYATAIQHGVKIIHEADCVEEDVLTAICGGLIVVDKQAQTVRFVHPTMRTYFENRLEKKSVISEASIALSCLAFFLSDNFAAITPHEDYIMQYPLPPAIIPSLSHDQRIETATGSQEIFFLHYASRYTIAHSIVTEEDDDVFALLKSLSQDTSLLSSFVRLRLHYSGSTWWIGVPNL
jgi:hypothetical protein